MTSPSALLKRELRGQLRGRIQDISPAQREQFSAQARASLARRRVWREAGSVLFYAPLPDEIDLLLLLARALAEGKTVALPRFVPETGVYAAGRITDFARDCSPGKLGILEPAARCAPFPLNLLDLALVPGVGFDAAGHRLGRGAGYFDRILAQVTGTRCGVAFDQQMVQHIPAEPHDVPLNCILTPTQWLEISGSRPLLP